MMEAQIRTEQPAKAVDVMQVIYTDGSKRKASITAAWYHPATEQSAAFKVEGGSGLQNSIEGGTCCHSLSIA